MFGMKNMGNKAAAALLKPHIPAILTVVLQEVIKAAGGKGSERCDARWFEAKRSDGTNTIMAEVYRLNELDERTELVGTIDVLRRAETIDLSIFIDE